MIILALETSTPNASLALWGDGAVRREWCFRSDRAHNARLFAPLDEALAEAEPSLLVVGTGPGSYAGVRVALSAALGLSIARAVPVVGWPSLTAWDAPESAVVVGDARRGGIFLAELTRGRLAAPPEIVDTADLDRRIGGRAVWTFDECGPVASMARATPTAGWLARRVAELSADERRRLAETDPEPLYLRAPFITTPKVRPAGR